MGKLKREQYSINIKWIDPNGWGIISTFIYRGLTFGEAEKKASIAFKRMLIKRYGYYDPEDMEIMNISGEKVKSGLFTERNWNVR